MFQKILKYIFTIAISLSSFCSNLVCAQGQTTKTQKEIETELSKRKLPVLMGVSVSADIVGFVMKSMGADWANMEISAKLNLKEKYFPVVEIGYGTADTEGAESGNTFNTSAPYFRAGIDYNFSKKWWNGNRIYAGIRYGFTSFNYDIASPDFADPVWDIDVLFDYNDLQGKMHWGELVFGMETRIWSFVYLGWNVRYKLRFSAKKADVGKPWFAPGFGKYDSKSFGGTFNIIFDI